MLSSTESSETMGDIIPQNRFCCENSVALNPNSSNVPDMLDIMPSGFSFSPIVSLDATDDFPVTFATKLSINSSSAIASGNLCEHVMKG